MKTSPLLLVIGLIIALGGSGCATSMPRGSAALSAVRPPEEKINWPAEFDPAKAVFFVHNQIDIQAPPEVVWDIVTNVKDWPNWYVGAADVDVINPVNGRVGPESVVRWKTMGLRFDSQLKEFSPPNRFAWESRKAVIRGYHAWLIVPTATGSRVISDEAFHGFLAYMQRAFVPNKLFGLHQIQLEELKKKAEAREAQRLRGEAANTPSSVAAPLNGSAAADRPARTL